MFLAIGAILTVITATIVQAEGPVDTAANVAHGAVDTAKNVTHSVVRGTKNAIHRVADAVTPESDANAVEVTLSDRRIDVPARIKPGKTAFVVHNTTHHTHNFQVAGPSGDYEFAHAVRPGQTKVLNVPLDRGTYDVRSTAPHGAIATVTVR